MRKLNVLLKFREVFLDAHVRYICKNHYVRLQDGVLGELKECEEQQSANDPKPPKERHNITIQNFKLLGTLALKLNMELVIYLV